MAAEGLTRWVLDPSAFVSGDDLHYGIGVRWSFNEDWQIFAEYTEIDLDIDNASIGLRYGF